MIALDNVRPVPLVIICGPTASGKTDMALRLAKGFGGEIISADSRQIYRYMDIGTAKRRGGMWKQDHSGTRYLLVDQVVHHLIDVVAPDDLLTLAQYQDLAYQRLIEVYQRGALPFLVGGTGLYIDAVTQRYNIPRVEPDWETRQRLQEYDVEKLKKILQTFDPTRAEQMNEHDLGNVRRLIRAIEVAIGRNSRVIDHVLLRSNELQSSEDSFSYNSVVCDRQMSGLVFQCLFVAPRVDLDELDKIINRRIDRMIEDGLIQENRRLVEMGYTYDLSSMSGIGYREIGQYLSGEIELDEAIVAIKIETRRYARNQLAWFRRNKNIKWVDSLDAAHRLIDEFFKDWMSKDSRSGIRLSEIVYIPLPPHSGNPNPDVWVGSLCTNCTERIPCLHECREVGRLYVAQIRPDINTSQPINRC